MGGAGAIAIGFVPVVFGVLHFDLQSLRHQHHVRRSKPSDRFTSVSFQGHTKVALAKTFRVDYYDGSVGLSLPAGLANQLFAGKTIFTKAGASSRWFVAARLFWNSTISFAPNGPVMVESQSESLRSTPAANRSIFSAAICAPPYWCIESAIPCADLR